MYERPFGYWAIWSFIVAYVILTSVFLSLYVHNLTIIHTWFSNLGAPGASLLSFRNTFAVIMIRIAIVIHIMSTSLIMLMIYNRADRRISIILFSIYVAGAALLLISIGATGAQYSSCNREYGNFCNDPLYCAAYGCSGSFPSSDPVVLPADLKANADFLGLFWMNFVLFIMQLGFIGVVFYFDVYDSDPPDLPLPAVPEPVEEIPQKKEEFASLKILTSPDTGEKKLHGLRNRK